MSDRPIVIIGAGGHAQVVADALRAAGSVVMGFTDRAAGPSDEPWPGLRIIGDDDALDLDGGYDLANGVGGTGAGPSRGLRREVQARLEARGFRFVGVRHPDAVVSPGATVADDVQILARAVVQAGARLEHGVLVNTGAIVEHGCRVGAFAHCASGSILCGDVTIGEDGHVGAGAVVRQGVTLEAGVVVGAGAVVLDAGTGAGPLVGVPARRRG